MSSKKKKREQQRTVAQQRADFQPDKPTFFDRVNSVIYVIVPIVLALVAWLVFLQHVTRLLLFAAAPNSHLAVGRPLGVALEGLAAMVTGWFVFTYVYPSVSSGRESLAQQRLNPVQDLPLPKEVLIDWSASQGLGFAITLIVAGPSSADRFGVPTWVVVLVMVACVVWAIRKGVIWWDARRSSNTRPTPDAEDQALAEALLLIGTKLQADERRSLEEGMQFIHECAQVNVRNLLVRVVLGTVIVALLYELGEQIIAKLIGG